MMNKKQAKEEKKRFWNKYKEFYDKIPLNCKLCKEFLEDGDFIEDNKVPYGCGVNTDAKADFIKNCDEFKLSKWHVVSLFKKLTKRIKELEENRDLNKKIKKK